MVSLISVHRRRLVGSQPRPGARKERWAQTAYQGVVECHLGWWLCVRLLLSGVVMVSLSCCKSKGEERTGVSRKAGSGSCRSGNPSCDVVWCVVCGVETTEACCFPLLRTRVRSRQRHCVWLRAGRNKMVRAGELSCRDDAGKRDERS